MRAPRTAAALAAGTLSVLAPTSGAQDALAEHPGTAPGEICLLYTSPSPRDQRGSRMPSSA